MREKKVPQRKCIICNQRFDKKDLIRIVKNKDDEIRLDPTFKANGRGAYICKQDACIDKFIKTKALDRAFKMGVDKNIYEEILLGIKDSE